MLGRPTVASTAVVSPAAGRRLPGGSRETTDPVESPSSIDKMAPTSATGGRRQHDRGVHACVDEGSRAGRRGRTRRQDVVHQQDTARDTGPRRPPARTCRASPCAAHRRPAGLAARWSRRVSRAGRTAGVEASRLAAANARAWLSSRAGQPSTGERHPGNGVDGWWTMVTMASASAAATLRHPEKFQRRSAARAGPVYTNGERAVSTGAGGQSRGQRGRFGYLGDQVRTRAEPATRAASGRVRRTASSPTPQPAHRGGNTTSNAGSARRDANAPADTGGHAEGKVQLNRRGQPHAHRSSTATASGSPCTIGDQRPWPLVGSNSVSRMVSGAPSTARRLYRFRGAVV